MIMIITDRGIIRLRLQQEIYHKVPKMSRKTKADVVLRAEKMFSERKLGDSNIMDMVNGGYMLLKKAPDGSLEGKTLG